MSFKNISFHRFSSVCNFFNFIYMGCSKKGKTLFFFPPETIESIVHFMYLIQDNEIKDTHGFKIQDLLYFFKIIGRGSMIL